MELGMKGICHTGKFVQLNNWKMLTDGLLM